MVELQNIKLIIWDMDDTFWKGTLSEGSVELIPENITLIRDLTDCGILHSICSKNDYEPVRNQLCEAGVWDYFVFPQISWNPKGGVVAQLIRDMNLRAENTLFIDDNPSNVQEVSFYVPEIHVCGPEKLKELIEQSHNLPRKDSMHNRLAQYRVLEKKHRERNCAVSNEAFLFSSDIRVDIRTDCENEVDRIHELIMRTNQLNYTKKRISREELDTLLSDKTYDCGYVLVTDRFGDYGISGFYCVKNGELEHFLFSCRAMGMGVEQYVYTVLNRPGLQVVGSVTYTVENAQMPPWINQKQVAKVDVDTSDHCGDVKILMKGPCDVEQILAYLDMPGRIDSELTYINPENGVSIESYNHTVQIVQSLTLSEERKLQIVKEVPFSSPEFFSKKMFSDAYGAVFFSLFTEPALGIYQRKETGEKIAFGQACYDLTNRNNWSGYMDGSIFNANCYFTEEQLEAFAAQYSYVGTIEPEEVVKNLTFIREHMPQETWLCLFLGVEFPYPQNTQKACEDRHVYHQRLNALVAEWANKQARVCLLPFGDIVKSPADMSNNINHFKKSVYYQMAQKMIQMIMQFNKDIPIKRKSWLFLLKTRFYDLVWRNSDTWLVRSLVWIKHKLEFFFK